MDEAYSLAVGGDGATSKDFGREAINELMTVMNDGDPVFIFAVATATSTATAAAAAAAAAAAITPSPYSV